jgi:flagellar biosynthetic protein FliR
MLAILTDQVVAALLVSLRIVPTLAFAPPFTLLRTPAMVRVALALGLAWLLVSARPPAEAIALSALAGAAASEALLGMAIALPLQLAFAALQTAGRGIDIQVGFGLAPISTLRAS